VRSGITQVDGHLYDNHSTTGPEDGAAHGGGAEAEVESASPWDWNQYQYAFEEVSLVSGWYVSGAKSGLPFEAEEASGRLTASTAIGTRRFAHAPGQTGAKPRAKLRGFSLFVAPPWDIKVGLTEHGPRMTMIQ
jgi:hypothetical protein